MIDTFTKFTGIKDVEFTIVKVHPRPYRLDGTKTGTLLSVLEVTLKLAELLSDELQLNLTLKIFEFPVDNKRIPINPPAEINVLLAGDVNVTIGDSTEKIWTGEAARYIPRAWVENVQEPRKLLGSLADIVVLMNTSL